MLSEKQKETQVLKGLKESKSLGSKCTDKQLLLSCRVSAWDNQRFTYFLFALFV